MKVIISREIKNYLRNPLYWIGALIIMATVFLCLKDYLNIRWYSVDEILTKPDDVTEDDADVYYGYIAADEIVSEEEKYERGLDHVREDFIQVFGMSEAEADEAVNDIKSRHMSIAETLSYMEEEYSYYGGNVFEGGSNIKATTECMLVLDRIYDDVERLMESMYPNGPGEKAPKPEARKSACDAFMGRLAALDRQLDDTGMADAARNDIKNLAARVSVLINHL